jgi:hypothetical protein
MSVLNFKDLKAHIGHELECVGYKKKGSKRIINVAITCNDCSEILLDFDNPRAFKKSKKPKR